MRFKKYKTFLNKSLSKDNIQQFKDTVEDYMLEWSDNHLRILFQNSTSEYESQEDLRDISIIRILIGIDFKYYDELLIKNKVFGTSAASPNYHSSEEMDILVNRLNNCFLSIMNRILKSYNIEVYSSKYYNPFIENMPKSTSKWVDDKWNNRYHCLVRSIRFKLLSKK